MKKLLFFLLLIFSINVFSVSISDYYVKPEVVLDKTVTISGVYTADNNANILCKFLIIEADGNNLLRLNDEYTFSDGSFYSEYKITEPFFYRGKDYNVSTTCNTASATTSFSVINREPLDDRIAYELIFLRDNGMTIFLGLSFLVILSLFVGYFGRLIYENVFK